MFQRLLKRQSKPTAAVFVDYEHWYYGYQNKYMIMPNVEEWRREIEQEYNVKYMKFFGNCTNQKMEEACGQLQAQGVDVIQTSSDQPGVDKDFTDFIILDEIYRLAAWKKSPDVFILFTGDAHFCFVTKYLASLQKKVIVYGVKGSLSNRLKGVANSYVEMPRSNQEMQIYYDLILKSLQVVKRRGKMASYWKTVTNVAEYNHIIKDKIRYALDNLIDKNYISKEVRILYGQKKKVLSVNWDRLEADGIWSNEY